MMNDRDHDLVRAWKAPPVPPGLRQRALAAARARYDERVAPGLVDRLWESHGLRIGWATAASLLLALNLLLLRPEPDIAGAPVQAELDPVLAEPHLIKLIERHAVSRFRLVDSSELLDQLLDAGPATGSATEYRNNGDST